MATMLEHFDSQITFAIPTNLDLQAMEFPNVTVLLSGMDDLDFNQLTQVGLDYNDPEYNRFVGDVWVGIVLTLMIVTSIFCMCACFLYHKFRQWKASVSHFQSAVNSGDSAESGGHSAYDTDSLPSYTLVSGLPSYDDALECYRKAEVANTHRPSLMKLFSFDNPLLGSQIKDANCSGELQQVVVVESKDGLPSYQETVAVVNEKKRTSNGSRRTVHKPILPLKVKDLPSQAQSEESTPSSAEEGSNLAGKFNFLKTKHPELPQLHKSPSLVFYDDEYWRNVHQQQGRLDETNNCGSSSLPRNFSRQFAGEC